MAKDKKSKDAQNKDKDKGITVKKEDDMPEWYTQIILKSELADYSPIKGCMVIRPNGYAVWQNIMNYFNNRLSELKVKNAYFPMFIPESFFEREKEHAQGFEPEVAWISNKSDEDSKERLALRPTSETIMYDSYSKWIRSWRDLPLRINQWCNIVRWEVKDVKLFLRSREFLWQEGHCVYETEEECDKETLMMISEYKKLSEELLAMPVIMGQKSEKEKFAGAKYTASIEGFMPDGKALQCGTSHNLGKGFAKAFGIKYLGKDEKDHTPWQSSWGFSTRLIGGVVMTHGDNKGLVLPPRLAPLKAVVIPILFGKDNEKVIAACKEVAKIAVSAFKEEDAVQIDDRDEYSAGWKFNEWEMKGIPMRIEVGPKDVEKEQAVIVRRDTGEKEFVPVKDLMKKIPEIAQAMQKNLFDIAKKRLDESIIEANDWDAFVSCINARKLVKTAFCGEVDCEEIIKAETNGATSRCIPFDEKMQLTLAKEGAKCVKCGKDAKYITYFSKSY